MKPVAIFRHFPTEGPGHFGTFLDRHALCWQLVTIDHNCPVPSRATDFSGLVFMGGPMSVNDALPWIAQELALIRNAVASEIPVLGHCLGGQLIAKALGGSVTRNSVKEIGWGRVRVTDRVLGREWLGELREFDAFHWHGETFSLPPGAQRVLSSDYCENQMFVLGNHVGMQCHVEMTPELVTAWCDNGGDEIRTSGGPAVQDAQAIEDAMGLRLPDLNRIADRVYTRWIQGLRP